MHLGAPAFAQDSLELTFQGRLPTQCSVDAGGAEIFLNDITKRSSATATLGIDCNSNFAIKMFSTVGALTHTTRGDDRDYAPGYRGVLRYVVSLGVDGQISSPPLESSSLTQEATVLTGSPTRGPATLTLTVTSPGQSDYPLIPGRYRDEIVISVVPRS